MGSIQGFSLGDGEVITQTALEDISLPCSVSLGISLNAIAQNVLSDDFSDDEAAWCKEHDARPPFVVTVIGPTEFEEATEGWWKEDGSSGLLTYETFGKIRADLKGLMEIAIPRLYAALTIQYANKNHPVKLRPIETTIWGRTTANQTIHDFRF